MEMHNRAFQNSVSTFHFDEISRGHYRGYSSVSESVSPNVTEREQVNHAERKEMFRASDVSNANLGENLSVLTHASVHSSFLVAEGVCVGLEVISSFFEYSELSSACRFVERICELSSSRSKCNSYCLDWELVGWMGYCVWVFYDHSCFVL